MLSFVGFVGAGVLVPKDDAKETPGSRSTRLTRREKTTWLL